MDNYLLIFFIVWLLGGIAFLLFKKKKAKSSPSSNISKDTDISAVASKDDVEIIKPRKRFFSRITLEESWQFLTEITEKVLYKFSPKDQELTKSLGKSLLQADVLYQHVIEYGISIEKQRAMSNPKGTAKASTANKKNNQR